MTIPLDVLNKVVDTDIDNNMVRVRALLVDKTASEICQMVMNRISISELLSALDDFRRMNTVLDDFKLVNDPKLQDYDYFDTINNIKKAISVLSSGA
ncbi:hypothetical protein PSI19_03340 [Xenorhabdus khoisanae]|uniref:hypothetical protein n=1 Tax=Xenorhabdus khoisanae TaxID=880157 RepID=UPI0023591338|nr:hypothetical protein [Xenorhabdus khoisanae]MDC9612932.1 hypothetical protein [Xenorhabdus khoisanae]